MALEVARYRAGAGRMARKAEIKENFLKNASHPIEETAGRQTQGIRDDAVVC